MHWNTGEDMVALRWSNVPEEAGGPMEDQDGEYKVIAHVFLKMARRVESMVCADTIMAPTFAAYKLDISSERESTLE
jgi:hypothetical protein